MLGLTFTACGNTTSSLEGTGSSNQVAFDVSKNIKVYTRDTDSGTRDGFFTRIGLKNNVKSNEGLVTDINGGSVSKRFSVRKKSYGIGVTRIFPVNAPTIYSIEVIKKGYVRRAKLSFLKGLRKDYKVKERN